MPGSGAVAERGGPRRRHSNGRRSFFFGFGTIVAAAGVAAPLTVVAAAVAIALLGNTLTQFSRSQPSAGSFVTFVGRTFGPWSAIASAIVLISSYIIALAAVVAAGRTRSSTSTSGSTCPGSS